MSRLTLSYVQFTSTTQSLSAVKYQCLIKDYSYATVKPVTQQVSLTGDTLFTIAPKTFRRLSGWIRVIDSGDGTYGTYADLIKAYAAIDLKIVTPEDGDADADDAWDCIWISPFAPKLLEPTGNYRLVDFVIVERTTP
jgi:hypothetical protein